MTRLTVEAFRELEDRERLAVLVGDVPTIENLWATDLLINGPHNQLLIGRDATLDMVRNHLIDFERFDRTSERVELDDGVSVSMGSEIVMQRRGPQAGELIFRRYTNVWRELGGRWQLRFRHANVVGGSPQILE